MKYRGPSSACWSGDQRVTSCRGIERSVLVLAHQTLNNALNSHSVCRANDDGLVSRVRWLEPDLISLPVESLHRGIASIGCLAATTPSDGISESSSEVSSLTTSIPRNASATLLIWPSRLRAARTC